MQMKCKKEERKGCGKDIGLINCGDINQEGEIMGLCPACSKKGCSNHSQVSYNKESEIPLRPDTKKELCECGHLKSEHHFYSKENLEKYGIECHCNHGSYQKGIITELPCKCKKFKPQECSKKGDEE